jgi:hypothetical protein
MKFLLIACLALSTAAFADSTTEATKTTTTKKAYGPATDSSMIDANMEIEKETKSTTTTDQRMEDENHMPTDTSTTTEKTTTEEVDE